MNLLRRILPVFLAMGALPVMAATALRHDLTGKVLAVDPARRMIRVHHEPIPGLMPEMAMDFTVPGADLSAFQPGQRVKARLYAVDKGEFALEGLRVADPEQESLLADAAFMLQSDTAAREPHVFREIGEDAPYFKLYNHRGEVVSLESYRGQRVVLNFIFTRCPVPTMCAAATARMMEIQQQARLRGLRDIQFLSISLDPAYDTPAVLKAYAAARGIDTTNFSFLTGPEIAVRSLLAQSGVFVVPSAGLWNHTISTLVIDRTGRIADRYEGANWDIGAMLQRLSPEAEGTTAAR
ncbi:MAG: SCO family protein [Opitutaceae bacterium]